MKKVINFALFGCAFLAACGGKSANSTNMAASNSSNATNANSAQATVFPTPSNKFTSADVAKLKWIEGSWRGLDGENPFYERYKIEETAMVVEELKEDGSPNGEPGRFELKNGEFGKGGGAMRSAASEIGDGFIQFVPGPESKGNTYRFERMGQDQWHAILDWPASPDKPGRQKVYVMERMKQ